MTKAEFIDLLARRLGASGNHVRAIVDRLHASRTVMPTTSCRHPPDIAEPDAITIFLAAIGAEKLDDAPAAASRLAALTDGSGQSFGRLVSLLLFGPPRHVGHLIVGRDGVSTVIDGKHLVFGKAPRTAAKIVPGDAVMAIAAELQGAPPHSADAVAAISKIRGI